MPRVARPGWVLALAMAALGRAGAAPPADHPADAAGTLPRSVELVVVMDDGASLVQSPAGAAACAVLGDLGLLGPLEPGWAALAARLGWTPRETFDRLVGTRVILVMRDVDDAQARRWALVSQVSSSTEERLKKRLDTAPRKIVDGHPILAIESGKYELTSRRIKCARPNDAEAPVEIILGPAGRSELFDQLVRAPGKAEALLAGTPAIEASRAMGGAQMLVLARIDEAAPAAGAPGEPRAPGGVRPWDDFMVVSCTRAEGEGGGGKMQARFFLREARMRPELARVRPASDAPFGRECGGRPGEGPGAGERALATIVESRLAQPTEAPVSPLGWLLGVLNMPASVTALLSGREALLVQTESADGSGPVSVTMAFETPDVGALAPAADTALAGAMTVMGQPLGSAAAHADAAPDLSGVCPQAVRTVPMDPAKASVMESVFGPRAGLAWGFVGDGAPGTGAPRPGWWVVSVASLETPEASAPVNAVRRCFDSLADGRHGGKTDRWLSLGFIRPSRLPGAMPRLMPGSSAWRSALGWVDSVTWRLRVNEANDIEGQIDIEAAARKP